MNILSVSVIFSLIIGCSFAEDPHHPEAGTGPGKGGQKQQAAAMAQTPGGHVKDLMGDWGAKPQAKNDKGVDLQNVPTRPEDRFGYNEPAGPFGNN